MEKLELKYLAPYLPYGLKVFSNKIETLIGIESSKVRVREFDLYFPIENCKPILRPLSDLTKEELYNFGFEDHVDWLTNERENWVKKYGIDKFLNETPFGHIQYLISKHYDIFGLIEKGLAVDINSTKKDSQN